MPRPPAFATAAANAGLAAPPIGLWKIGSLIFNRSQIVVCSGIIKSFYRNIL
jgi:hypothetical protein